MAIDDNTKYAITGEQVKDLAQRLALSTKSSGGAGAPTESTEGELGQFYIDNSTGDIYYLSEIVEESGEPDTYVWSKLNGGGGGDVTSYYVNIADFMAQSPDFHIYKDISLTQMATYPEILEAYKTTGVELVFADTDISDLTARYHNATKCTFVGAYFDGDPSTNCFEIVSQMIYPYGYSSNGFYKFAIYSYNYWDGEGAGDGFSYFWQDLSRPSVVQYTGSSTTNVMSQKAVTDSLNGKIKTNAGAPTTSTVGTKGQLLSDTTNGDLYICTDANGNVYTWSKLEVGDQFTMLSPSDYAQGKDYVEYWTLPAGIYKINNPNGSKINTRAYSTAPINSLGNGTIVIIGKGQPITSGIPDMMTALEIGDGRLACFYMGSTGSPITRYDLMDELVVTGADVIDALDQTKVHRPLSANQGKVLNEKIEGRIKTNAGAPTTSTTGTVGQLLEDITNGKLYICTEVSGNTYTWEEVGSGGGGGSDHYVFYLDNPLPTSPGIYPERGIFSDFELTTPVTLQQVAEICRGQKTATLVYSNYWELESGAEDVEVVRAYSVIGGIDNGEEDEYIWYIESNKFFGSCLFDGDYSSTNMVTFEDIALPNTTSSTGNSTSLVMTQRGVTNALNGKIQSGSGAPTTSTQGTKGQLYSDTTNGKIYICTAVTGSPATYTWEEVGASGLTTRVYTISMGNSVSGQGRTFNLPTGLTAQEIYEKQQQGILTIFNFSVKNASAAFSTYTVPVTAAFDGTSYSAFGCSPATDVKTVSFVATGTNTTGQAKIFTTRNIVGSTPPSTNTTSYTLGTLYHDTSTDKTYICTLVNESNFTSTWTEIGAGGGSNTMVLYTNQDLPDAESSSYHLYSDINLTTTVNTRDIYDCYKSGGNVVLIVPTSSDNPGRIYAGYVAELYQVDFDADDGVYTVSFLVKEFNANPKLYSYAGSTGNWYGKTDFVNAVSPSVLSGMIATNAGAPTSSTAGTKGQLIEDTTNGKVYVCTDATNPYVWKEVNTDKMVVLSYGSSTWSDFINAYNSNSVIYCRASSNTNPATGSQNRMAFMAYVSDATTPTNVEFQYYRSVNSKTASQQCDQVFIYKLTNANGGTWTVETREAASKIVAGTNMTSSYSSGTLTLNCSAPVITVQSTDPGEGAALAENHFIGVFSV